MRPAFFSFWVHIVPCHAFPSEIGERFLKILQLFFRNKYTETVFLGNGN